MHGVSLDLVTLAVLEAVLRRTDDRDPGWGGSRADIFYIIQ